MLHFLSYELRLHHCSLGILLCREYINCHNYSEGYCMLIAGNIFVNSMVGELKANIQKWSEGADVEGGSIWEFFLWSHNRV